MLILWWKNDLWNFIETRPLSRVPSEAERDRAYARIHRLVHQEECGPDQDNERT